MRVARKSSAFTDPERRAADNVRARRESPSERERIAAAQARVAADRLRGVQTEQWIVDLAKAAGQRER